jgi:hypothetical protein
VTEVIDAVIRTMLFPPVDDALGQRGADPGKPFEFGTRGAIDIDQEGRSLG